DTAADSFHPHGPTNMRPLLVALALFVSPFVAAAADNTPPPGFVALFNGKDLSGWKGLPVKEKLDNPFKRQAAAPDEMRKAQAAADQRMRDHWKVQDGALVFDGKGDSLCTARDDY